MDSKRNPSFRYYKVREITFESFSGETLSRPSRFETIKLWNNITGQTREVEFLYNSDSSDGSVTNLYTIMEVQY